MEKWPLFLDQCFSDSDLKILSKMHIKMLAMVREFPRDIQGYANTCYTYYFLEFYLKMHDGRLFLYRLWIARFFIDCPCHIWKLRCLQKNQVICINTQACTHTHRKREGEIYCHWVPAPTALAARAEPRTNRDQELHLGVLHRWQWHKCLEHLLLHCGGIREQ